MNPKATPANGMNKESGFALERLFFQRLLLEAVSLESISADAPADQMNIGWDWAWVTNEVFDVLLTIELTPWKSRPERFSATVVGRFRVVGTLTSLPIEEFARFNAPAILFPYVRQQITDLTSAGQVGPLLLAPLNVQSMMEQMDTSKVTALTKPRPS